MRQHFPLLALVALALAAYANSLTAGFAFDGRGLALDDPRVRALTAENVGLILDHTYWWPYGESGLYRPATTFSFLLNHTVFGFGTNAAGYHAVNVLLHALNAVLLALLATRIVGPGPTAWFIAAVWAVHPVLTESVANIAGRADLLATAAVLTGMLAYHESRRATPGRRARWLAVLAGATMLGVFSKESGVVLVGLIALYEICWWDRRKSWANLRRAGMAMALPLIVMLAQRSAVLAASGPGAFPFTETPSSTPASGSAG
jgi:hypothetical protein